MRPSPRRAPEALVRRRGRAAEAGKRQVGECRDGRFLVWGLTEGDDHREKNPNRPYAKDGRWFSPEGRTKAAGLGSAGVGQEPGGAAGFSKSAVLFWSSLWTLSVGWRIN